MIHHRLILISLICTLCLSTSLHAQDSLMLRSVSPIMDDEHSTMDSLFHALLIADSLSPFPAYESPFITPGRFMSTNIESVSDSLLRARLQSLPFFVEVPYNSIVRAYILRYLENYQRLERLHRKANYYFPMFDDLFCRYELPYELCYLSIIESALNAQARSQMGAAGLWQFMPSTGKRYGLEINSLVDERLDPEKSTEAACRYLKALYRIFNDWNLTIAAYNCGPGNINKAIHRAGGRRDFWSIYPYLPRETRHYLPLFIAASYAMNFANQHGMCSPSIDYSFMTDTVMTSHRLHLQQVADVMHIDMEELRRLNPQYIHDIIPGGEHQYVLTLPLAKAPFFAQLQDTIFAYNGTPLLQGYNSEIDMAQHTPSGGVTYYKIRQGDTLGAIAKRFHVSVSQLKRWNNLHSDAIRAGKTLRIGG